MISSYAWSGFILFILSMLALDLGVFNKKNHTFSLKEALSWSGVWILMAIAFAVIIFFTLGKESASTFLSGYIVEKALSVDNLFVFIMIFGYLKISPQFQHKVLFYGIIGALVMRALFIWLGIGVITKFSWVLYIFGAFLVFTGIKILTADEEEKSLDDSLIYNFLKTRSFFVNSFFGGKFLVKIGNKLCFTPLFLALVMVEISDIVFAIDSIPAVIGITKDPFIVFTSNVFAILGLRSLYFALEALSSRLYYLKHGLSIILVFIGLKMILSDFYHFPNYATLIFIVAVLGIFGLLSYLKEQNETI